MKKNKTLIILTSIFAILLVVVYILFLKDERNNKRPIEKTAVDTLNSEERVIQNIKRLGVMKIEAYKYYYKNGSYDNKGKYENTIYFDELGRRTEEETSNDMVLVYKYDANNRISEYYSLQSYYQYWNNDYKNFLFKYVNKYNSTGLLIETDTYERNKLIEVRLNEYDAKKNLVSYKKQTPNGKILSENNCEYNEKGFVSVLSTTMYPSNTNKYLEKYHKNYVYNSDNLIDYVEVFKGDVIQFKGVYKYEFYDDKTQSNKSFEEFAKDFINNSDISLSRFISFCDSRIYTTNCDNGERIKSNPGNLYRYVQNGWLKRSKYDIKSNEIIVHIDEIYSSSFSFRKKAGQWKLYYYMNPC